MTRTWIPRLVLVVVCSLSPLLRAQQEVVENHPDGKVSRRFVIDANGKKQGELREFAVDGTLTLVANYKDDALDGVYRSFHAGGKRRIVARYIAGKLVGRYAEFGVKGRQIVAAYYARGVRIGAYERWHENGKKAEVSQYKDGLLHGPYREMFDDGKPKVETTYGDGLLHGSYQSIDRERSERVLAHYVGGALHGIYRLWVKEQLVVDQIYQSNRVVRLDGVILHPVAAVDIRRNLLRTLKLPAKTEAEQALRRLQAYRQLCVVPFADIELKADWNVACADAARVCEMNGKLSHYPSRPEGCDKKLYDLGALAASCSNLARGPGGLPGSVDQYMDDSDRSNIQEVGHRRWCLNPKMAYTGFGKSGEYSAMWSIDGSRQYESNKPILYPAGGYVPVDFFAAHHAWSVMMPGTEKLQPSQFDIRIQTLDAGYRKQPGMLRVKEKYVANGDASLPGILIFRPAGVLVRAGMRYWVEIADSGGPFSMRYLVEFTDPVVASAPPDVR